MMKVITLAILCSVIGALAQNLNCGNDGSTSLTSCLSNPNIRIEKVGGGGGDINHYRLSLNSRNTWWAPVDNWIECRGLCENCETLPGINNDGENT